MTEEGFLRGISSSCLLSNQGGVFRSKVKKGKHDFNSCSKFFSSQNCIKEKKFRLVSKPGVYNGDKGQKFIMVSKIKLGVDSM
jgi:hypothetical protein